MFYKTKNMSVEATQYNGDNLEELKRFQKQLDIIAEGYRAQSLEHPILEPQGSRP